MCVAFGVREGQVNMSQKKNHNVYFNTKVVFLIMFFALKQL